MPDSRSDWPADCVRLCESAALVERGPAWMFNVLLWRQPARAFALRFDGRVVAYLNRCAHVAVEMDWQPGEFLCDERRWIICSMHGAAYEPADGRCVAGPCRGARLMAVTVHEADGWIGWVPSPEVQPPPALDSSLSEPLTGASRLPDSLP